MPADVDAIIHPLKSKVSDPQLYTIQGGGGGLFGHMSVFGVLNVFVGAADFDEMVKTLREYELSIKEGHVFMSI